MFKVFVAHPIPEAGLRKLAGLKVTQNTHRGILAKANFMEQAKDADGLITFLSDKIDRTVLNACPHLKIISNYAVGFDNIDVKAAQERGIIVTNTPDVLTEAVAEHAIALMLAAGRRVVEADHYLRAGQYRAWEADLMLGKQFQGETIGIVGCGRIGARVAEIAHHGFQMKVLYFDVARNVAFEAKLGAKFVGLTELLRQSDVVSLHVPLLDSTRHLINEATLRLMRPDAVLVNTARGPVVDEQALVQALKQRTIAAAGLDVFEFEPELAPGLADLTNVVVSPHIGSATITARDDMARLAAQAVLDVANRKMPVHLVRVA